MAIMFCVGVFCALGLLTIVLLESIPDLITAQKYLKNVPKIHYCNMGNPNDQKPYYQKVNDLYDLYVKDGHYKMMDPSKMIRILTEVQQFFNKCNQKHKATKTLIVIDTIFKKSAAQSLEPLNLKSNITSTDDALKDAENGTDGGFTWVGIK